LRTLWKHNREAREATTISLPSLSDFSSDEAEEIMERFTLGDYGRLNNLDEVAQGFQLANHVFWHQKLNSHYSESG